MPPRYHSELFYHIVWATKYRKRVISRRVGKLLKELFAIKSAEHDTDLIRFNNGEDHVHLLIRARPETSLAKLIKELKGYSTFHINKNLGNGILYWQRGYGIFTVSPELVPKIIKYIDKHDEGHGMSNKHLVRTDNDQVRD